MQLLETPKKVSVKEELTDWLRPSAEMEEPGTTTDMVVTEKTPMEQMKPVVVKSEPSTLSEKSTKRARPSEEEAIPTAPKRARPSLKEEANPTEPPRKRSRQETPTKKTSELEESNTKRLSVIIRRLSADEIVQASAKRLVVALRRLGAAEIETKAPTPKRSQNCHECAVCPKVFSQKNHLQAHMTAVHLRVKSFKCDLCPYATRWRHTFSAHKIRRHAIGNARACTLCTRTFATVQELTDHVKGAHLCLKSFKCDQCPFESPWRWSLNKHKKGRHSVRKTHPCDSCAQVFSTKWQLAKHVKGLHGLKYAYVRCDQCPFESQWATSLVRHKKSRH